MTGGQASLEGFEAPASPTDRLFFAILPDAEATTRIERLVRDLRGTHGLKGKPLGAGRFHVSLYHVGDFAGPRPDVVAAAREAAAAVRMPPFKLGFDRVASFKRPRNMPLVLLGGDGVAALTTFQQALESAMTKAGFGRGAGPHYTPHLTLLYDDHRVTEQAIEPIAWAAHEFVLVRSLIGHSRHDALAHLRLRG